MMGRWGLGHFFLSQHFQMSGDQSMLNAHEIDVSDLYFNG